MFYKYFLVLKRLKPALEFIIAGHFDQLLPVNDRANFNYKGLLLYMTSVMVIDLN